MRLVPVAMTVLVGMNSRKFYRANPGKKGLDPSKIFQLGQAGAREECPVGIRTSSAAASTGASAPAGAGAGAAAPAGGVGVQVAAYSSNAAAEAGWAKLSAQHAAILSGVRHRVVEGTADIGKVYRLQAVASDAAAANALCGRLKAAGTPCQVK